MIFDSENLNMLWGRLLVEECVRNGIDFFCISPGSRSTPLTVAAAGHPRCQTTLCYDERGAAYMALGYAKAGGKPAALICTSGTAVANYFPAVVEAAMDDTPMLLLTADRPPELQDSGANQTIHQRSIYGSYARWFFNFEPPTAKIPPQTVLSAVDLAIHKSRALKGPVHLNFMFREPLAPCREDFPSDYSASIASWSSSGKPFTRYDDFRVTADLSRVTELLAGADNGLLVAGNLSTEAEIAAASRLAEQVPWPCFADISSGLRTGANSANLIGHFDQILLSGEYEKSCLPDVILHLGGRITSKRFQQFLEKNTQIAYVQINTATGRIDPAHVVKVKISAHIENAVENLAPFKWRQSRSLERLQQVNQRLSEWLDHYLKTGDHLSEPAVARAISRTIAPGTGLFLSNSMPVRDMDMFANAAGPAARVGANRGASGIDGILASATGFANGLKQPVTCLIGDLALIHDLNSLYLVKQSEHPLTIVLINNGGGGIFHFLPIADHKLLFPWFETPHQLRFEEAAKMFGLAYKSPKTPAGFKRDYDKALDSGESTLIEVCTDKSENQRLHVELQDLIKEKLNSWLAR